MQIAAQTESKSIINCDADPFAPGTLDVVMHIKGGMLEWDASKVSLYSPPNEKNRDFVDAQRVIESLTGFRRGKKVKDFHGVPVLNANVLDYLLAHPEEIPEYWKKDEKGKPRMILFLGTKYYYDMDRDGGVYEYRYLYFHDGLWRSNTTFCDSWPGGMFCIALLP